jgi:hypothetical protein
MFNCHTRRALKFNFRARCFSRHVTQHYQLLRRPNSPHSHKISPLPLSSFLFLLIHTPSRWPSESFTVSLYVLVLLLSTFSSDSSQENGRTISVLVAAKHNGLDLELVKTEPKSAATSGADYRKIQPLGKIPAFEGANGFNLFEVIAIAIYGTLLTSVLFGFRLSAIRQSSFATRLYHDEIFLLLLVIPVRTILLITTTSDSRAKKIEYPASGEKFCAWIASPFFLDHDAPLAFLIA